MTQNDTTSGGYPMVFGTAIAEAEVVPPVPRGAHALLAGRGSMTIHENP